MSASAATAAGRSLLAPEPAEIVEKRSWGPDIHAFRLALRDPDARRRFDFTPGQFDMVYAPGVGEVAISISSDPSDELLEHTIRVVGRTTRVIGRLGVGDTLGLRGPYGRGWPLQEARWKDVLVVTGGLGCAPVAGAVEYIFRRRESYGHVAILHGVKQPGDLIHGDRFEQWRHHPDTEVLLSSDQPDRRWRHRLGVVTGLFDEVDFDPARTVAFLCGPEVMMGLASRILVQRGLRAERIFLAMERNMQCAVGLCGHCQLAPFFVCKDGPIFQLSRVQRFFFGVSL